MSIESFFKRKPSNFESSSSSDKYSKIELNDLPYDPGERKPISSYNPSKKDDFRRTYLAKGPCQPILPKGDYKQTIFSGKLRRFNPDWYKQKHGNWLEYSLKKDKVYYLFCYLFPENGQNDAFVSEGVRCCQKIQRFDTHASDCNSPHYIARKRGEDLVKLAQYIQVAFEKQTDKQKNEYRIRLSASVKVVTALLNGGLPFRGHGESEDSLYRGHFIEFLKVMGDLNGVSDLAQKMVETRKNIDYPLVYRLIKLLLVLPVATASVERSFSSMKHVKTELRNRMGDGYMNDCCVCYIENEFFQQVSLEDVMQRFQAMKTRRQEL